MLEEGVRVASLFLDGGEVVVLRGAHLPEQTFRANRGVVTRLPVTVLVDRATTIARRSSGGGPTARRSSSRSTRSETAARSS